MTVKVSAKLTKEEQVYNGLDAIRGRLCNKDDLMHGEHFGVFRFHVMNIEFDVESGEWNATIKLDHIEPALATDVRDAAQALLEDIYKERTGRPDKPQEPLPQDTLFDASEQADEGPVAERDPDVWLDDVAKRVED